MNSVIHSKSRTILRLLIVLVLVCFGLPARAAPNISANPTEVIFYTKSPNMQKSTTITWDAEAGNDPVGVYVTVNGTGEQLMHTGATGTKTAKFIKLNNTYEFCLWGKDHSVKLKCVTVATKLVEVKLQIGLIHNLQVTPRGHSVKISFTTDRTAAAFVQVSDKAPKSFPIISKEDVAAFEPQDVVSASLPSIKSSHSVELPKLEPGKDFFFVIAAHDKQTGLWFKVKGKFRTLQRKVSVTFQKIKVINDSDDLSPGDLVFGFFVNGQNAPNGKPMTFGTHTEDEATKTSNITGSAVGAPTTLTLKTIGYDDDETEWIPVGPFVAVLANTCGAGDVTNPSTTEGENSCGEWTSGSKSFDLKAISENVSNIEDFTQTFTVQARPKGDDSEVSFDVTGTFRVQYVP
jgi:hypothetical protein